MVSVESTGDGSPNSFSSPHWFSLGTPLKLVTYSVWHLIATGACRIDSHVELANVGLEERRVTTSS